MTEFNQIKTKKKAKLRYSDEDGNLVYLLEIIHKLIHATDEDIIEKYLKIVNPNEKQLGKINYYRLKTGNCIIS